MASKTQDMPPPGGYTKIDFKRIPARKYFSGYQMIFGYLGENHFFCDENIEISGSLSRILLFQALLLARFLFTSKISRNMSVSRSK